jgi:curved DNA-binding protein CbpA
MAMARESRETTFKDLYEILGVPRGADEETLRSAYRAKARELHPEVSKSPEAEERFKELSHAYDVLSKPRSRLLYDRLAYRGAGGGFGQTNEAGRPQAGEAGPLSEDELIGWVFTEDAASPAAPVPREDRVLRIMAAIALAIAIVLIAIVLVGL